MHHQPWHFIVEFIYRDVQFYNDNMCTLAYMQPYIVIFSRWIAFILFAITILQCQQQWCVHWHVHKVRNMNLILYCDIFQVYSFHFHNSATDDNKICAVCTLAYT